MFSVFCTWGVVNLSILGISGRLIHTDWEALVFIIKTGDQCW